MKRRLFNATAGLSLLLWVATAALWVHWSWDSIHINVHWPSLSQIRNRPFYFPRRTVLLSVQKLTGTGIAITNGPGWIDGQLEYTDESLPHQSAQSGQPVRSYSSPVKVNERSLFGPPGLNPRGFRARQGGGGDLDNGGVIHDLFLYYSYRVSDWLLLLIFAPLPVWWLIDLYRTRRRLPGCCSVCGYDLRATPDRCPECGAVPVDTKIQGKPL